MWQGRLCWLRGLAGGWPCDVCVCVCATHQTELELRALRPLHVFRGVLLARGPGPRSVVNTCRGFDPSLSLSLSPPPWVCSHPNDSSSEGAPRPTGCRDGHVNKLSRGPRYLGAYVWEPTRGIHLYTTVWTLPHVVRRFCFLPRSGWFRAQSDERKSHMRFSAFVLKARPEGSRAILCRDMSGRGRG